jgi:hypothetical protein
VQRVRRPHHRRAGREGRQGRHGRLASSRTTAANRSFTRISAGTGCFRASTSTRPCASRRR